MPIHYIEQKDCGHSLLALRGSKYVKNIIIGGDFIVVLSRKEKKGGIIVRDPFKESMEDLIANWDLVGCKTKEMEVYLDKHNARSKTYSCEIGSLSYQESSLKKSAHYFKYHPFQRFKSHAYHSHFPLVTKSRTYTIPFKFNPLSQGVSFLLGR